MPPRPGPSRHLLTVLHAAERTGPPLLALQFLRWLRDERPNWQLSTLFLGPGELVDTFAELGPTLVDAPDDPDVGRHSVLTTAVRRRRIQRTLGQIGQLDLAHVHCVGSMRAVPMLPRAPVLCHVHELSVGQDLHCGRKARKHVRRATRYVAVADAVRNEFVTHFEVEPSLVERHYGFVDATTLPAPDATSPLNAPDGAFVVMASGVRHWRKAPDLFVRTAASARRRHPDVPWCFVWVGGADDTGIEALLAGTELGDAVRFVAHQSDPLRWLAVADVFLLSAREDAFPLVCVESAALGRPIVTFNNGGTTELVERAGGGAVVPFPDVDAAADALAALARSPDRRHAAGEAGRAFAHDELLLSIAAPRLLAIIEATMEPK